MEAVDAVVVGAGVIGMAVARALCMAGRSVVVVERHSSAGTETSSRNSGVIHSGIYYPTGSVKARLCVRGRILLYEFCAARDIAFRRCGKLIVSQEREISRLQGLLQTATANEVDDLLWIDAREVRKLEPQVRAAAALLCPSTGIVSAHELIDALHADIESGGGVVAFRTELVAARRRSAGFEVDLCSDDELTTVVCGCLVNSAGLGATALLGRIDGYPPDLVPSSHFAKGNYFEYSGRSPFTRLIYPMPGEAGLGVHGTLDLGGRLRFGPDVQWLEAGGTFDYTVDPARGAGFYDAIREYWPELPDDSLRPAYAGIRPKLVGKGIPAADFRIEGEAVHGVQGLVNLLGMESPGLTASLAIAEEVRRMFD